MTNIDTSTARVDRVCAAFAVDLQHSCDVANAVDLLRALAGERDAMRAELAEARNSALDAACDDVENLRISQPDDDYEEGKFDMVDLAIEAIRSLKNTSKEA